MSWKLKWKVLFIILCFLHLGRAFYFASSRGTEQDSAWYLGVAKNLADKGIYASSLNVVEDDRKGAFPNIQSRYSIQDENGYIYFPEGVTVGPGYILPQALLIKIFGSHTWVYRLWPFITYSLLFIFLFYLLMEQGGPIALLLFFLWNWCFPQLSINYAYEAYSESIALLYLLLAYLFFTLARRKMWEIKAKSKYFMFFSGTLFSIAVLTKTIFWLYSGVFLIVFFWDLIKIKKKVVISWAPFILGLILPIFSFEFYRFIYLIIHFGQEAYILSNKSIMHVFKTAGSGFSQLGKFNTDGMKN